MNNLLRQLFGTRSRQPQTAHCRPPLAVERLEDRWTPANLDVSAGGVAMLTANPGELNDITLVLNQGTARYEFTDNGAVITVSGTGALPANADVQGAGTNMVTAKASFLTSITIDTGDFADFVKIRSTAVPTTVITTGTGDDNDAVTVGNAGSVQGITAVVHVTNVNALSTLVVDDSADVTARTVTVSDTTIHGLAPADITYDAAALGDVNGSPGLTVNGGTGGNTFTVSNTIPGPNGTTTLNTGSGNDTVVVQAGSDNSTVNVNGQGGSNTFTVTPSATAAFNFSNGTLLTYRGAGTLILNGPGMGSITAPGVGPVTFTAVTTVLVGAGTLQFSEPVLTVAENAGSAVVTVTRTGGSFGAVSVQFSTTGGTATAGADYAATTKTVSFADGDLTPKTVSIPIVYDKLIEGNETLVVTLSNPTGGAALGNPVSETLTIVDVPPVTGDVTKLVSLSLGRLVHVRGNLFRRSLTITNTSTQFILGPVRVVITKLPGPKKKPFRFKVLQNPVPVPVGSDNLLTPGESSMVTLQFRSASSRSVRFTLSVLAG
jgi:hypothetical protein